MCALDKPGGFIGRDAVAAQLDSRSFMKKRLVQGFKMADQNADGGLSVEEFLAMEQLRAKRSANAR